MQRIILMVSMIVFVFTSAQGAELDKQQRSAERASLVDYRGFLELSKEVESYRQRRLLSIEAFVKKSKEKGVIILDTRSKAAYDAIHVKGAMHLNFSDFTADKLQQLIADKNTCILIYCNNNFESKEPAFASKKVNLALNVPTFINLYGYGYKNVYELRELLSLDDERIEFVRSASR